MSNIAVTNADYLVVWNDCKAVCGEPLEDDHAEPLMYMAAYPHSLFTQHLHKMAAEQAKHRIAMDRLRQLDYLAYVATVVFMIIVSVIVILSLIIIGVLLWTETETIDSCLKFNQQINQGISHAVARHQTSRNHIVGCS